MTGTDSHTGAAAGVNGDETARERIAIAAVFVLACAWRLADIAIHPWAPDEGFTFDLASSTWARLLQQTLDDVHPPFYYALVKCWYLLTLPLPDLARVLSVLFSIGALAGVRLLAKELFGKRAAWVAFLVAAFSPYAVYWSHVARNHQLLPLCTVFAVLWAFRYLHKPSRRAWWWSAVWTGLAIQTNYLGLVFCALWCGALVLERRTALSERFKLCAALAPGLIIFSPWVPVMMDHTTAYEMNVGFFQEQVSPVYFYFHALFGKMVAYQPPQEGVLFLVKLVIFAVIGALGLRAFKNRFGIGFLIIAMPALPIAMVSLGRMTLAERHLVFALPIFFAWWGAASVGAWDYFAARFRPSSSPPIGG